MINPEQVFQFSDTQRTPNSNGDIQITWTVPEHLPYFEGHFPGNPMLPGVALLDLFQVLLRGQFHFIKSVKFTEPIRPLDTLSIYANKSSENNHWSIQVTNQSNSIVCKATILLN